LQKILEGKSWRFTKYDAMRNDPHEGKHIFNAYDEACRQLYHEKEITPEQFI
jgi:hypothetical protein